MFEINLSLPPPRETGLLEIPLAMFRDFCAGEPSNVVTDRSVWKQHIGSDGVSRTDLSQYAVIKDQTGPSCTSNAIVGAYENVCRYAGYDIPILSAASVFGFVGSRMGSSVQSNVARMTDVGCVPETMWPSSNIWNSRKPAGFDEEAKKWRLAEMDWCKTFDVATWMLFCGHPIHFGVNWGGGGHSIYGVAVVFQNGKWGWKIANSWGEDYGDDGFGVLWERQIASGIETRFGAAALRAPTHVP